jgi:hypothetical protein
MSECSDRRAAGAACAKDGDAIIFELLAADV